MKQENYLHIFSITSVFILTVSVQIEQKMAGEPTNEEVSPYTVVRALNEFSFELFGNITRTSRTDETLAFSPISLFNLFAMLLEGLGGRSLEQVAHLLHFDKLRDRNDVNLKPSMLNKVYNPTSGYDLIRSDRFYIDKQFDVIARFKNILRRFYDAKVKKKDFKTKAEKSCRQMNRYVAKKTERLIPDLLSTTSVTQNTTAVILNSLIMKAGWDFPFSKTDNRSFHLDENRKISIPFMLSNRHSNCIFQRNEDLRALVIALPFEAEQLHMIIIMPPNTGNFSIFDQPRILMIVNSALKKMFESSTGDISRCGIYLPTFTIERGVPYLKKVFQSMGVQDIFDKNVGNFSKITSTLGLCLENVDHKTVMNVNENGVNVEAIPSSPLNTSSSTPNTIFAINKPFVFMIRHKETESILFMGKFVGPVGAN